MKINRITNQQTFGAKIIVEDEKTPKFIKSSYLSKSKALDKMLDIFDNTHTDTMVTVGIKNTKNGDILQAINSDTGNVKKINIKNADILTPENHNAFYNLVKEMLNSNDFWTMPNDNYAMSTGNVHSAGIEHDVFRLDKRA